MTTFLPMYKWESDESSDLIDSESGAACQKLPFD